ncbi:general transcription factor 3C polypeptide 5 (transcription factor C subunit 1) [Entomortierella parvispora]|uniref:General transcription factor 3C polypeptide 5 (Transcription factor C subunit 1) n=1 Tax=Entomortierella parvispora TaxID=205924 RepID=A0A9P3HBY8_9FUNG|nr:general transcription factor 3C polypeptide 5 (transcription factor C subunit 1) [Entomortierella parvispora]
MARRSVAPEDRAPVLELPEDIKKIFSVEFPGHIQNSEKAKQCLGGDNAILNAYLGGSPLDMRYRLNDPFAIPLHGTTLPTSNLLVKVTRRYRVKRRPDSEGSIQTIRAPTEDDVPYDENEQPEISYEMVGAISKTTRFYGLADYQVLVDPKDEVYKIKSDLLNMNYESLIALKVDHRNPVEDVSTIQILPPPHLSKTNLPNPYRYRAREGTEAELEEERVGRGKGRGRGRVNRAGRRRGHGGGNGRGRGVCRTTNVASMLQATTAAFTATASAALDD